MNTFLCFWCPYRCYCVFGAYHCHVLDSDISPLLEDSQKNRSNFYWMLSNRLGWSCGIKLLVHLDWGRIAYSRCTPLFNVVFSTNQWFVSIDFLTFIQNSMEIRQPWWLIGPGWRAIGEPAYEGTSKTLIDLLLIFSFQSVWIFTD